jgi:hypothetical protein
MPIDKHERERRRALLHAHYEFENCHDVANVTQTFAPNAEMIFNCAVFPGLEAIQQAHVYMGFSDEGAFRGIRNVIDRESYTDEDIVVEGRLCATHVAEFLGFAPTERRLELPFVAFYRFDATGKLSSERIVMNLGPLAPAPASGPAR